MLQTSKNQGLFGKGFTNTLTLYHTIPTFDDPGNYPFENNVGKGENAGNHHFLLLPSCFLTSKKQISVSESDLFLLSANACNSDKSKILLFGNVW